MSTCRMLRVETGMFLLAALDDVACEPVERGRRIAEPLETCECRGEKFIAALSRGFKTQHRRVGRLVQRQVRTGRFADDMGFTFHIEDVVLDLEGDADVPAKPIQGGRIGIRQVLRPAGRPRRRQRESVRRS